MSVLAEQLTPPDLLGEWRFERTVDDRREARRMPVHGVATFTLVSPSRIEWRESGVLESPSGPLPVEQTRHVVRGDGGEWRVLFADGRDFHPWAVDAELVHDCAPDVYRGHVHPTLSGSWILEWTSTGPAKDYTSTTTYSRAGAGDAPV
ncbi:DUF6314 family protein [Frondihabitans cladoniiphilus]|uniref:DUF6314 domain-containing protein n=1 Tax=Frondihabitans cladoniiphilus TaxID=715785 RepID=A0ABP8WB04_9MICO